eukprot:CAMPEP_0206522674 /NCGR_PEP_ID=MMETSP0324_2-20121206/67122_1 /ASSEMBLY_ACC=CAM_ASM_000836 /TAXON_ID=2866 /ORGANISM="Crypthecodinium cohnii, Strain Seligo" /LENGTH=556 /DNA_ID=CAMNT_0054016881 /DNA_START=334 /DNA_END=2001 /DNA_ORIENTATION=-
MAMPDTSGIRRVFIELEHVIAPVPGKAIPTQRAANFTKHFAAWKGLGVEILLLSAADAKLKTRIVEGLDMLRCFDQILSWKGHASKGDYIADQSKKNGWIPTEQILIDHSVNAIGSTAGWHFSPGDGARQDTEAVANTFRVPQDKEGLSMEDLAILDDMLSKPDPPSKTFHYYAATFQEKRFLDNSDEDMKCLEFLTNKTLFKAIFASNPSPFLKNRPDLEALKATLGVHEKTLPLSNGVAAEADPTPAPAAKPKAAASVLAEMLAGGGDKGKGKGKGKSKGPPPMSKAAFMAKQPPKEKGIDEGSTVEVTEGMHEGKRGKVVKVTGEGAEARYRVHLDGMSNPTWVDKVKAVAGDSPSAPLPVAAATEPAGPPPKASSQAPAPPPTPSGSGEGAEVEVMVGPHKGKRAKVVKTTGEGKDMRWRVEIVDGPTTWVDEVSPIETRERGQSASAPVVSSDPFGEGATVEVVEGLHAGKTATVLKVTGTGAERRWRVQLENSTSSTWTTVVKSASGLLSSDDPGSKPEEVHEGPLPEPYMYLDDYSESEETDSEMPDLQ